MKYFFDTEFIEGFKKPISWLPTIGKFNKPYHSIQLISIGIVAEDGKEYYAVSNEFNAADANPWVWENVISKLGHRFINHGECSDGSALLEDTWKSNKQIANEVLRFVYTNIGYSEYDRPKKIYEFYAYYADYDWVVFCSMFGTMMDLPKGFPMYCRDLKQTLDESPYLWQQMKDFIQGYVSDKGYQPDHEYVLEIFKAHNDYPKQTNEHNALADAKWNFELYKFLQALPNN